MSGRLLITSTVAILLAGPAFADCKQEIESLKGAVTEAETGASTTGSGMPATQHQEQVLAGKPEPAAGASTAAQPDAPASPHQADVLAGGKGSDQQPAELMAKASDMAEAGNEEGCMQQISEVKSLLGVD